MVALPMSISYRSSSKASLFLHVPFRIRSEVVDAVPAERTGIASAVLEPLEQTNAVERVPACAALLVWQHLVGRHDRVTNRTFCLSLQRPNDVAAEGRQAVDDPAILYFSMSATVHQVREIRVPLRRT